LPSSRHRITFRLAERHADLLAYPSIDPVLITSAPCHPLVCLVHIAGLVLGWAYARHW
jgi:hypothetical protein